MKLVKLTCTDNDRTLDATVMKKSERFLEVVVEGTNTKVVLKKDSSDEKYYICLLYTSPSPRDGLLSRMPSSA